MLRAIPQPRRSWVAARIAAATIATLLPAVVPNARAAELPVYQASVPLPDNGEAARAAAFRAALLTVAVRASGRRDAGEAVAGADPQRYVQQYAATSDRRLKVGFDPRGVEQLLVQSGLPVWAAERPAVSVVLQGEPAGVQLEAERAGAARGLPLVIQGGVADAAGLAAAVASSNAAEVLRRAGAQPGAAALLSPASAGGGQWVFVHAGQLLRASGGAADAVHAAADALAARYAPATTRSVGTARIGVGGIGDYAAYAGTLEYLAALSGVRAVAVEGLEGDVLRLRVSLRGDLELLRRFAALEQRLLPPGDGRAGVDFLYSP
jgi:hypothetical protein